MKIIAIVAITAVGSAASALASEPSPQPSFIVPVFAPDGVPADRPFTKAPPVTSAMFSWTGCYVGTHLGGVVSEDKTNHTLFGNSTSYSSAGFVWGGQIGCDYQFSPGWVAGVEGRAAVSGLKNSHPEKVTNLATGIRLPTDFTVNNQFLASTTARLGYSFAGHWLVYVRGGGAWTREEVDDAFTNVRGIAVDPSASLNRAGWTVGTGLDWAFAPHWSATLEYNYYDFGSRDARLTDTAHNEFVTGVSIRDAIHAVTAGVNYHF